MVKDLQSLAMFDNSKLSVFFYLTLNLPIILTNLISLLVLILHRTIQRTFWHSGSTETYMNYLTVKGFEPTMHRYNCFFLLLI